MAYDEQLANRIREALASLNPEEKKMFRGITFMVNGKMCVSVGGDEIMCRIDPALHDEVMERNGCREMVHGGKVMRGFIFVNKVEIRSKKDFDYWINLAVTFNSKAKASVRKRKSGKSLGKQKKNSL